MEGQKCSATSMNKLTKLYFSSGDFETELPDYLAPKLKGFRFTWEFVTHSVKLEGAVKMYRHKEPKLCLFY